MRLNTLGLSITLVLSILPAPLSSDAQPAGQIPRVGLLSPYSGPATSLFHETFRQGLRELGYVDGHTIVLEYRSAEGRTERLPALAAELLGLKVDVIVTSSTPAALAAKQATRTIPVVFTAVADPILSGLVASYAQPGGNVTGLTHIPPELDTKRLELLKEAVPSASRVGVLWHPEFPPNVEGLEALKSAAPVLGVELQLVAYRGPQDLEGAFAAIGKGGAEALFMMPHPVLFGHTTQLAELAARSRLPAISPYREFAQAGGLMTYGAKFSEMYRRAAALVEKILKGAKPTDVPVERAMRFELVINQKTAQALGLAIPSIVLMQADEVLE